jgi:hypothetical protein
MTEPEWKAELRRQLEAADEAQVRAELRELSAGGEDRRQFVVGCAPWLTAHSSAGLRSSLPLAMRSCSSLECLM